MTAPGRDCPLCPRLAALRRENRRTHPDWFNAPVPSFGPADAASRPRGVRLLIVGLAPGLRGANRTGRPFTGDAAGDFLYETLRHFGLAAGTYGKTADDGLRLRGCRIANAVRCVPPANKPTPEEIRTCGRFLAAEIAALPGLAGILALGTVAHGATLAAIGEKKPRWPFRHGGMHRLPSGPVLADSYHCSRQNTNTGRLTAAMFRAVIRDLLDAIGAA